MEPSGTAGGRSRATRWQLRGLSMALFLALWEVAGRSGDYLLFAPPSAVGGTMVDQLVVDRTLLWAVTDALFQCVIGYGLAAAVGVPVGFLIGFWAPARDVLGPVVDALYATPMVALAPLIVIWFGLDVAGKVLFVFAFAVFVVVVNTEAGVTETPEGYVDAARVFGVTDWRIYTEIHLRHALPYVLTGLRLGAGRAVRGMVAAELFLFAGDLGSYLIDSGATFQVERLLAAIATLSLLGVLAVGLVGAAERRLRRSGGRAGV